MIEKPISAGNSDQKDAIRHGRKRRHERQATTTGVRSEDGCIDATGDHSQSHDQDQKVSLDQDLSQSQSLDHDDQLGQDRNDGHDQHHDHRPSISQDQVGHDYRVFANDTPPVQAIARETPNASTPETVSDRNDGRADDALKETDLAAKDPGILLAKTGKKLARPARSAKRRKLKRAKKSKNTHYDPVSPLQARYLDRAVRDLASFPETVDLAASIKFCAAPRIGHSNSVWSRKCGHPFCPRCRRTNIGARVDAANRTFSRMRADQIYFVTVLCDVIAGRPMDLVVPDPFDTRSSPAAPSNGLIRNWIGPHLSRAKEHLDRALKSLKPVILFADGSFEFSVLPVTGAGVQKDRFLAAFAAANPGSIPASAADVLVLHVHMLLSAKSSNRPIGRDEIAAALRKVFPHQHQVEVRPLDRRMPLQTNVMRLVSYALKAHTDFRPERVRDLALILPALGRKAMAYRRRWT